MKVSICSHRPVLEPCSLEGHAFQVDPYVGCQHHCYYCYALSQAETDWDREVQIHHDLVGQLRDKLSGLEPQSVYIGWNSDAYQPSEAEYQQTRKLLEMLAVRGFSVSLLTKSDLVIRDIDLFQEMPEASVGISMAFQDEHTRRLFEANSPSNRRRIQALKRLREAGVRTYTLICPVLPFITDVGELIDQVAPYADTIWVYALTIDGEEKPNWQNLQGILGRHYPGLQEEYREITFRPEHPYWARLRRELEVLKQEKGLKLRIEL